MITNTENGIPVIAHCCACDCKSNFNRVRSNGDGAMGSTIYCLKFGSHLKDRTSPGTLAIILPDTVTVHMAFR